MIFKNSVGKKMHVYHRRCVRYREVQKGKKVNLLECSFWWAIRK